MFLNFAKKIMKKLAFTVFSSMALVVSAQNQGTVIYQMSVEGLPPEQASMMGDMDMKIIWKGNRAYIEQNSMMYSMKTVSDEKSTLMLMDMMGKKSYMRVNAEKQKDKQNDLPEYKVEYTNDTKKIAGYDCKKAIVTFKIKEEKDVVVEVWYSEQIPNVYNSNQNYSNRRQGNTFLAKVKGLPLEYTIPQGQMLVKVTTTEINFNPVSDDVFNLSTDGYTEMKSEDMKKMGGGQ